MVQKCRAVVGLLCIVLFFAAGAFTPLLAQKPSKKKKGESALQDEFVRLQFVAFIIEGNKHLLAGNYADAFYSLDRARVLVPTSGAVNHSLAKLYAAKGDLPRAELFADQALKSDARNRYYYEHLGRIYEARRKYADAAKLYKKLVSEGLALEDHYFDLAAFYYYADNKEGALQTYDLIIERYGPEPDVFQQKIQIYLSLGKMEEALTEMNRLIAFFPEQNSYYIQKAGLLWEMQRRAEARSTLETVLTRDPNALEARRMLGDFLFSEKNWDEAFKIYRPLIQDKNYPLSSKINLLGNYSLLVFSPNQTEETQQVKRQYQSLVEDLVIAHPTASDAWAFRGDFYRETEEDKLSWESYLEARKFNQSNANLWLQILALDSKLRKPDSLIVHGEEAISNFPNQALFWYYTGSAYLEQKKYPEAIAKLEQARKLSAADPELRLGIYAMLGDAYYYDKNFLKSDAAYEEVLKADPENDHVLNNYSYFLALRKEKLDKADAMMTNLLKRNPKEANYLDTYAWVKYAGKKYAEAKELLEQALTLQGASPNGAIVEHYGDVLYQLGEKEQALVQWKKALNLGDTSEFLEKKIRDKVLYE
jgi:tetratricopeptide (TPR) repeat protein